VDIENVMEFLVEHRAPNVVPGYVSEQLLSMSWIIDAEDVARIVEVGKQWLTSDDPFRVAVAIGLENETYLADSWEEIAELAEPLKERFPSMAADVDAWMARAAPAYERRRTGSFFERGTGDASEDPTADDPVTRMVRAWATFDESLRTRNGFDEIAYAALTEALRACATEWAELDAIPRLGANVLVDVFAATEANAGLYEGDIADRVREAAHALHDLVGECVALRSP
jgi:hypothetical protein